MSIARKRSYNFWGASANWSHFFDKETVISMYVTVYKGQGNVTWLSMSRAT